MFFPYKYAVLLFLFLDIFIFVYNYADAFQSSAEVLFVITALHGTNPADSSTQCTQHSTYNQSIDYGRVFNNEPSFESTKSEFLSYTQGKRKRKKEREGDNRIHVNILN